MRTGLDDLQRSMGERVHFSGHRQRARLLGVVLTAAAAASACGTQQSASAPPPETVTVAEPAPQTNESETDESTTESTADESTPEETASESETDETTAESTQQEQPAPQCQTNQLRARLYPDTLVGLHNKEAREGTPSDNSNTIQLRLANVGAEPCTVQGSARLAFTNGDGGWLGGDEPDTPDGPGNAVTLGTRDGAVQDVTWFSGVSPCIDPLGLEVYPPGQDEPIKLPWNHGAVCQNVKLQHGPLRAG